MSAYERTNWPTYEQLEREQQRENEEIDALLSQATNWSLYNRIEERMNSAPEPDLFERIDREEETHRMEIENHRMEIDDLLYEEPNILTNFEEMLEMFETIDRLSDENKENIKPYLDYWDLANIQNILPDNEVEVNYITSI